MHLLSVQGSGEQPAPSLAGVHVRLVLRAAWLGWGGSPESSTAPQLLMGFLGCLAALGSWVAGGQWGVKPPQRVPTACGAGKWLGTVTLGREQLVGTACNFGDAGVPLLRAGREGGEGGSHPLLGGEGGRDAGCRATSESQPPPQPLMPCG